MSSNSAYLFKLFLLDIQHALDPLHHLSEGLGLHTAQQQVRVKAHEPTTQRTILYKCSREQFPNKFACNQFDKRGRVGVAPILKLVQLLLVYSVSWLFIKSTRQQYRQMHSDRNDPTLHTGMHKTLTHLTNL